jgi:hypothetical protein
MSSSPWERLWNGDEDVATPFHVGGVSRSQTIEGRVPSPGGGGRDAPRRFLETRNWKRDPEAPEGRWRLKRNVTERNVRAQSGLRGQDSTSAFLSFGF